MPQAFLTVTIQVELMKNEVMKYNKVRIACEIILAKIKGLRIN